MGPPTPLPTPLPTTAPPTTAPVTPPSEAPVVSTFFPSKSLIDSSSFPTNAPFTPPTSTTSCQLFTFFLTTDNYGYETSFTLTDLEGRVRFMGGGYEALNSYDEATCLVDGFYKFTIFDSHGDGICCGDNQG